MATTFQEYNAPATYSFTFPSYQSSDVKVRVDGVLKTAGTHYNITSYTTGGGGTVVFIDNSGSGGTNHTPSSGVVRIYRDTNVDVAKASYTPGSSVKAADLNNNQTQLLYRSQEEQIPNLIQSYDIDASAIETSNVKDGAVTTAKIAADAVTGAKIADDQIGSEHYAPLSVNTAAIANEDVTTAKLDNNAVTTSKIENLNVTRAKLEPDAVDGTKLADNAVNTEHYTDNSIQHVHLQNDIIDGDNIQDDVVNSEHIVAGALDNEHYATGSITSDKLSNATVVTASEQASAASNDTSFLTTAAADARFFNVSTGDTIKDGQTFPDNDTSIATTAAINDRIIDLVDDVGGFVPIANETSFPTANPDVNNGSGTLVSIKSISSSRTPSSGTVTIANGAGTGNTVTITGCGSTVLAAGFGVIVETTSTLHTYAFHRLVPKATEVTTVASNTTEIGTVHTNINNINTVAGISSDVTAVKNIASDVTAVKNIASDVTAVANDATDIGIVAADGTDIGLVAGSISNVNTVAGSITSVNNAQANLTSINNFGDTYQVASSNPSTDGGGNALAEGDLYFNTSANELKVYNGSSWQGGVTATSDLATLGANTFTGNQVISTTAPSINFTDTDDDSDFKLVLEDGLFRIQDATNNFASRLTINSSGVVNVTNHLDVANGIDVLDGNITMAAGHTVDGRDVSADGTKIDNAITSSGDLTITNTDPAITLTDTQSNAFAFIDGNGGNLNIHADKGNDSPSNVDSTLGFGVDGAIRMTLDHDGYLGIGTTNPARPLTIRASDCRLRLEDPDSGNTNNASIELSNSNGNGYLNVNNENSLNFQTDNLTRVTITGTGDTNINGKLTATGTEHLFTAGTTGDLKVILQADSDNDNAGEGDSPHLLFRQDGTHDEGAVFLANNTLNIASTVTTGGGINLKTSTTNSDYLDAPIRMNITPTGQITMYGNVDCNSGLDVTGTLNITSGNFTCTGSLNTGNELNFTGSAAKFIDFETLAGPHRFELRHHNSTAGTFATAIKATASGAVDLFFDTQNHSTPKLSTTASGIKVDRIVTIDGSTPRIEMKVTGDAQSHRIEFFNAANSMVSRIYGDPSGNLEIQTGSGGNQNAIKVNSGGAVDLHHNGSSAPKLSTSSTGVTVDGKVGIGTTSPSTMLEISSNADAQTTATIPTVRLTNEDGAAAAADIMGSFEYFTKDTSDADKITGFVRCMSLSNAGVNYDLAFGTKSTNTAGDATEKMRLTSDGNLGIGTTNPSEALDVNGNIHVTGNIDVTDGTLIIDTTPNSPNVNFGLQEAIRIDDAGGAADRGLNIYEYREGGMRFFTLNYNLAASSTGSAYQYTQGLYGGSSMIRFDGHMKFYVNAANDPNQNVITPTKRFEITSSGVGVTGGITTTDGSITQSNSSGSENSFGTNINISTIYPSLHLNDTDSENDWKVQNQNGKFAIHDADRNTNVLTIEGRSGESNYGEVGIFGDLRVDNGTNTTLSVKCDNGGNALIRANGDAQGTGAVEVGQSDTYGGGIAYNGDGSPSFASGETADHIMFYRLSDGSRTEVFSYPHNSNVVRFNSVPTVGGTSLVRTSDTIANATDAANVTGTIAAGVTATTQSANDNSTKVATTAYVDNASTTYTNSDVDAHLNRSSASTNEVLSWNGSDYAWVAQSGGGGISNLVEDTTPELGGDLTVDGHDIIIEHQDQLLFKRDGTTKLEIKTFNGNQQFSASQKGVEFNVVGSGDNAFKVNAINGSGTSGADIYFKVNNSGAEFKVSPLPKDDDDIDLGSGSLRWDNVYATNAAIQSSDQNLKQDIQALTTAEKAVATTLKGLIKTFKYKKAVAAKGDKARIHCGVIAQEVKAAFEAQGLTAEDYALFCYDEWDATPEEKDEDGTITKLAVPAGNRYSIRYTELLAFIISAL